MDIRHHIGILWRWRAIMAGGFLLAVVLGVLVSFNPGLSGFEWRSQASYMSTSKIFVTQPGFPWGRATLPGSDPTQPPTAGTQLQTFAPSSRFTELAVVYSYLAQSDEVRRLITPAPLEQQIRVATIPNPATNEPLPILEIATTAQSAEASRELNRASIAALRSYLRRNVAQNKVPADEQVTLEVLNPPRAGMLVAGRSLTRSVIIWLLVMTGALVAVYVLENLNPRPGAVRREPLFPRDPDDDFASDARWEPIELGESTTPAA
jgi:hypothetical protein